MIVKILVADLRAVCICVVTPTQYPSVGDVCWEEVAQPVYTVSRCPCLLPMTVQTMDCDNTVAR